MGCGWGPSTIMDFLYSLIIWLMEPRTSITDSLLIFFQLTVRNARWMKTMSRLIDLPVSRLMAWKDSSREWCTEADWWGQVMRWWPHSAAARVHHWQAGMGW